jgi:TRAP-type C4-dicarboxylate transport system substrate-binding protein
MPLAEPTGLSPRAAARLGRRTLLASAAVGLASPSLPRFARAAEVTWRLGHNAPADFPLHVRLMEAAKAIETQSAGRMVLEVHPNSELGSSVGLFAQLRVGTIDVVPVTCQLLAEETAFGSLPMLGFVFPGYDAVWTALDGDLGSYMRSQIKERLALFAMDRCWNFGLRQVTTSGKVVSMAADIEGLRLRSPPEADFIGLLQALKVLPVTTPLSGLERALQTHALDGQEGVLPLVRAARLYMVQSTCALTNHVWDGHWICVSQKAWLNLPLKLKDIVAAAFNESGLHQRQDTVANDAEVQKDLETKGMKFNAVDTDSFRQALRKAGYYAAWQTKMGDGWALLEKYSGHLT